ncbi:MAG TPA: hypothetical protein VMD74_03145, partial [Candidatus Methylomirabilis sp.]|nr:hypothetical protein [Candidatus Methylomirabilis sp.]
EGKLLFPKDLLELSDIKDGDSIMNLWVERPREIATSSATLGEIIFSGITPGGYQGAHGLVFTAVFTPKDEGAGVIDIGGARALLNDGEGTPDSLTISPWSFTISKNLPIMLGPSEEDLTPPEEFKPEISSSTAIFSGRWFLVFTAQDKGSGIAGYAVFESKQLKSVDQISASDWTSAETPYLLKDQSLKSYLYVKAIDKAGNERVETIAPRHPSPAYQYQNLLNWMMIILASAIAVLCLITLGLLIILFWKKIRIKKT